MTRRPTLVLAMVPFLNEHLLTPAHWQRLEALCEMPDREPLTAFAEARAPQLLAAAEMLLTGWGCPAVDAHVLAQAPKLGAIVHAAGTVKEHLSAACWDRSLVVTSAAAANAVPVAEYTLAAILFANKRVLQIRQRYREVRGFHWWPAEFPNLGNFSKTIGVVGASFVGRKVIDLLRPFAFEILLYDPFVDAADAAAMGVRQVDLDELLREADIVTMHAPALPEPRHMLDRTRLALMKDGATLINTARGALIELAALEDEMKSGRLCAVIDTTEPEILPPESPLYDLPNVMLTPHIAGSMGTETQRMAALAIDEIERIVYGKPLHYAIQRSDLTRIA